ncbi:MAG: TIGR01841 family phasin, partial [Alphaproteobacteria bacterium]|nr:TIGR01841 family phasin [Alphaproteobacteria bacterium]
ASLPADQRMAKQTAIAQMAFEKALSNAKELAEIVGKTSRETSDIVNKRITASVEEFRKMVKPS